MGNPGERKWKASKAACYDLNVDYDPTILVIMEVLERMGVLIANRRAELGLGQQELADKAGLHRTYISDIERGRRNMTIGTLQKLASVLGVTMADLMKSAETPAVVDDRQRQELNN